MRTVIAFSICLFISVSVSSANTDYCSDVDLSDSGGSMEHVAVRNQRSIGDCYAHVAAQIYDAWRFVNGSTHYYRVSSGFEINQRFKIYRDESSINSGKLIEVLPQLVKEGSCSEFALNYKLFKDEVLKNGMTVDEYASRVMSIYKTNAAAYYADIDPPVEKETYFKYDTKKLYPMKRAVADRDNLTRDQAKTWQKEDQYKKSCLRYHLERGVNELKVYHAKTLKNEIMTERDVSYKTLDNRLDELDDLIDEIAAHRDTVEVFDQIGIIGCEKEKTNKKFALYDNTRIWRSASFVSKYPLEYENFTNRDGKLSVIHEELNLELTKNAPTAMPIGISYCSSVLDLGRKFPKMTSDDERCGRHASLIVGRRRNPKTQVCEFKIRNTWGAACNLVTAHGNKVPLYHPDWNCVEGKGSVWVEETTLSKAIFNMQVMKRDYRGYHSEKDPLIGVPGW